MTQNIGKSRSYVKNSIGFFPVIWGACVGESAYTRFPAFDILIVLLPLLRVLGMHSSVQDFQAVSNPMSFD
jgi:hypothetical protein